MTSSQIAKLRRNEVKKGLALAALIQGRDANNRPIYAYVAVPGEKWEDFEKAQRLGNFNPAKYGTVLAAGSGEPAEEVKKKMESEYGVNHASTFVLPGKSGKSGETS